MNAKLNAGGKANFSFPANYNTAALVIEGNVKVNGVDVPTDNFVLLKTMVKNLLLKQQKMQLFLS